jgi:hypothetical protein
VERALEEPLARDRLAVLPPLRLLALLRLPLLRLPLLRLALLRLLLLLPLLPLLPLLLREPLERLPLEREDELRPDEPPELEPLLLAWGIASPSWDRCWDARQATHLRARCARGCAHV